MLSESQVKPFLLREDRHVRDAAASYLRGCWSRDPELVPLVVRACGKYSDETMLRGLGACKRFTMTQEGLDRVLAHIAGTGDRNAVFNLNRSVARAPVALLEANEAALARARNVARETLERVRRRSALAARPTEELWMKLHDLSRRCSGEKYDSAFADDIVAALAERGEPDAGRVCEALKSPEARGRWVEVSLADLAGALRLREAVPILVEKFGVDDEYMPHRSAEALARIGAVEAVRFIRDGFARWDTWPRFKAASALGDIKREESADAALALLETEADVTVRTGLCLSLCDLLTDRCVGPVAREIERGYDSMYTRLEDHLLTAADMLGIALPEGDRWRAEREEQDRWRAKRRAEMEEMGARYAELKRRGIDPFAGLGRADGPAGPLAASRSRDRARPSLNAPCPCGSGKKYKRCCGRRA